MSRVDTRTAGFQPVAPQTSVVPSAPFGVEGLAGTAHGLTVLPTGKTGAQRNAALGGAVQPVAASSASSVPGVATVLPAFEAYQTARGLPPKRVELQGWVLELMDAPATGTREPRLLGPQAAAEERCHAFTDELLHESDEGSVEIRKFAREAFADLRAFLAQAAKPGLLQAGQVGDQVRTGL